MMKGQIFSIYFLNLLLSQKCIFFLETIMQVFHLGICMHHVDPIMRFLGFLSHFNDFVFIVG